MQYILGVSESFLLSEGSFFQVFRKAGIEKYDPSDEQFDPNRHNAVFQVPDNSKPPGTVAVVLKVMPAVEKPILSVTMISFSC